MKALDLVSKLEVLQESVRNVTTKLDGVTPRHGNYMICFFPHYMDFPTFSVWGDFDLNSDIKMQVKDGEIVVCDSDRFAGNIEEAREALKQYLDKEI